MKIAYNLERFSRQWSNLKEIRVHVVLFPDVNNPDLVNRVFGAITIVKWGKGNATNKL